MKTLLILSLLVTGCGRDESGSDGEQNPVAATGEHTPGDFNSETQLYSINHRGFETKEWSFNLLGYKIHTADVGPFDNQVLAEMYQQKTAEITKKFADGTKMVCNMHVFIGVIRKSQDTGKPSGGLYVVRNGLQEGCNLKSATLEFSFTKACQDYGTREAYPCSTYDIVIKETSAYYGN